GPNYANFTFAVQDDGLTATVGAFTGVDTDPNPKTFTFNVIVKPTAPTASDKTFTTLEDTGFNLTSGSIHFGFQDSVDGNGFVGIYITSLPTAGTLLLNGVAITAADVATIPPDSGSTPEQPVYHGKFVSSTQLSANNLVFQPAPNAFSTNNGADVYGS